MLCKTLALKDNGVIVNFAEGMVLPEEKYLADDPRSLELSHGALWNRMSDSIDLLYFPVTALHEEDRSFAARLVVL